MYSFPYPRFLIEYGEALSKTLEWAISVNPDFLVAIARRGPRLIELAEHYELWSCPKDLEIISDRALLFTPPQESTRTISIFDDVLIYGSTMRKVLNAVIRKGFFPVSFVIAKGETANPNFNINAFYTMLLRDDQFSMFNTESVKALRYLAKPYDIEHPLFYLPLKSGLIFKKDIIQLMKESYPKYFDITNNFENQIGIMNAVILDWKDEMLPFFVKDYNEAFSQSTKIRMFINLPARMVCVEPISLFNVRADKILDGQLPFTNEASWLNELIQIFLDVIESFEFPDRDKELATVCATIYLAEWLYGYSFVLESSLFEEEEKKSPAKLMNLFDIKLMFGRELCKKLMVSIESLGSSIMGKLLSYLSAEGK
ncbi:MAG: hypothetical protein QXZ70_07340 [Candidatus Bathyarchaeia archaeon]